MTGTDPNPSPATRPSAAPGWRGSRPGDDLRRRGVVPPTHLHPRHRRGRHRRLRDPLRHGDCFIDYGHPADVIPTVEAHADEILADDATMVTLGGDHFVTYPLLRAHARKFGPLALIHFDAHSDTWDDDGTRLDHGSMFLRAAREGLIDPARSAWAPTRPPSRAGRKWVVR